METETEELLGEVCRLLEIETLIVEVYKLNSLPRKAIEEARSQIKSGQFLTNEEANKEIDEWLEKSESLS
jgi:predicted transcriptional regulator